MLFCVALLAYSPALKGGLLWDDASHVTRPELRSLHGLWRIWFELGATQQYYPLLHTAFWAEHKLWGDAVLGYHLTNVLLHASAACFMVLIMRRLSLPGAWLAGFIFALHPVCVEAVAWISEQKSTLSTAFYLGSVLAYLHFDRTRRRPVYFLALALFILALLSKTVTATLPAALLVVFWWQKGRLNWKRDVLPLAPWLMLGAAAGLFTAWVERNYIGAQGSNFALPFLARILLAARVIWFYIGKLLWPADLIFNYPHWNIDTSEWWQYLFPLGVVGAAAGLWLFTRKNRGPLAAFLFFIGTLFPVLGFLDVYPFVYSYVADHFQYLASLGIIVPAAAVLTTAAGRIPIGRFAPALAAFLLAALGTLTWRQSGIYKDVETLYRVTLVRNPGSVMAHNNLGNYFLKIPGRVPEAISQFEAALALKPDLPEAHNNLGTALSTMPDRLPDAITQFETALRNRPNFPEAHNNLGRALSNVPGRAPEAIQHFEAALALKPDYADAHYGLGTLLLDQPGRSADAVAQLEAALQTNDDSAQAHNSLGIALSRIPGRAPEAIAQFEAALRINPDFAEAHNNLAGALGGIPGRAPEAISHFEAALRSDPNLAEAHMNLGSALVGQPGRLPEAISHLEAAVRIKPDYEQAHAMLAVILSRIPGRSSDAITHFETAVRLRPEDADAQTGLGLLLLKVPGRLPEAIQHLEAAMRIQPDPDIQALLKGLRPGSR
ncbi:MAG: tetratricopeptide repeat protein [Bryobacteraceae bacterium]